MDGQLDDEVDHGQNKRGVNHEHALIHAGNHQPEKENGDDAYDVSEGDEPEKPNRVKLEGVEDRGYQYQPD